MNEEKTAKGMTIEDLARLMQGEFLGIKESLSDLKADVKCIKDNASELFTKLDKFISLTGSK